MGRPLCREHPPVTGDTGSVAGRDDLREGASGAADGVSRAASRRVAAAVAVAAMALAALAGTVGLEHPPQTVNPDEWHFVPVAMRTANSPDLDPGIFMNPSGPIYAYVGWLGAGYAAGRVSGRYGDTRDLAFEYLRDPTPYLVQGRWLSCLCGIGAAGLLAYGLSRRFGALAGAFAGAFAAGSAQLQIRMHAAIDEPMLVLVCSGALLALLAARDRGEWRRWLGASALVGLAAGTKYNGALLALPWAIVAWGMLRSERRGWVRVAAGAAAIPLVFLATTPHAILSWPDFSAQVAYNREQLGTGGPFLDNAWVYLQAYGVDFLVPGAVWTGLAGLWIGRRGWDGGTRALVVHGAVLCAVLLVYLSRGELCTPRYAFPAMPWVVAMAAVGTAALVRWVARRTGGLRWVAAVALGLAVVPAAWGNLQRAQDYAGRVARFRMTQALALECRPGDRVVTDWYGPLLPQTAYLEGFADKVKAAGGRVMHLRAHQFTDYLGAEPIPLPEGGDPTDLARLRELGYRFAIVRQDTVEKVRAGEKVHPRTAAFIERLEALGEPEVFRHADGRPVYRVWALDR